MKAAENGVEAALEAEEGIQQPFRWTPRSRQEVDNGDAVNGDATDGVVWPLWSLPEDSHEDFAKARIDGQSRSLLSLISALRSGSLNGFRPLPRSRQRNLLHRRIQQA